MAMPEIDYRRITVAGKPSMADIANKWAGEVCYVNGIEGRVTGRLLPFAHVRSNDGRYDAEYSWSAVDRIMQDSKCFRTF